MNGPRRLFAAPGSSTVVGPPEIRVAGLGLSFPIPSQRLILAIGFAVLAAISAASIALDVKSRSEAAWVHHTLDVTSKLTDLRLLFRRAESAARGYLLTGDPTFVSEYDQSLDGVGPGYEWLKRLVKDNPAQEQLLATGERLVERRFAAASDMMRLHAEGDSAGIAALSVRAEGRALMESISANFDQLAGEEQRLLASRSAASQRTGSLLLAVDLCCTGLILILVALLIREGRRSRRKLTHALSAAGIANESLEAAVAERTAHLLVANEKLRDIERKLHQSQKLDAIGKLTGGVAHDFNNMLTVIAGTTEILVADLGNRPELQAVAALIDQAADRCTELIQQLLAFARKQPLQPRNVDLNATIADIGKLLRPTLGEQIEIGLILENGMAAACIDPSQLANALINLAVNARDAMPDGGKLILETANVVLDEAYAQGNPDVRPGAYGLIAVSDTGTGMSADMCEKVFEPFFTTKASGKGTGLGLSMVYGFVKQSGGHIKIYSEEGHGTTVKLYLPCAGGCVEAAIPVVLPTHGAGETILVVEDDDLVRGFVTAQLDSLGYRTVAVADSAAALAHVERGQPFDLLFTDVVMPGAMTGRQLADEVTRLRPGTKILYTSGYTENSIVHHGRLDRGVLLLSKPYRKAALASMVRLALGDAAGAEARPSLRAGTSIAIPMRRRRASYGAPSSG